MYFDASYIGGFLGAMLAEVCLGTNLMICKAPDGEEALNCYELDSNLEAIVTLNQLFRDKSGFQFPTAIPLICCVAFSSDHGLFLDALLAMLVLLVTLFLRLFLFMVGNLLSTQ